MRGKAALWLRRALGVGLLLGVWQLASLCFSPLVLPPVPQVAGTLAWLIREPDFWPTVGTTLLRLALGLGIIAVGSILGLLFGLCPKLEDVGAPFIHVLQSVPPVCWVVLALVWFGFNGWPCVFIVAASTIPTVVINLSHGVRGVDPELLEMARLYRFSRRKVLLHVTLPSIRPYFLSALEIVVGGGLKLAVMGEVLTTNSGIGGAITTARLNIQPDAIIAWAFLLVAGCLITQKLVCLLLSREREPHAETERICKRFEDLPATPQTCPSLPSRGEIVALIGPSGCGKTTLLNIISGLTAPDAGTVEGADGRLSYMFSERPAASLAHGGGKHPAGAGGSARRGSALLITAVGLEGFECYYPGQLSGGMARRCAPGPGIPLGGEIFLMDEPFQGLDYGIRMEMLSMLLSIWQRGGPGCFFVTHEIDEALTVATRIAVLARAPLQSASGLTSPARRGGTPPPLNWPGCAKRSSGGSPVRTGLVATAMASHKEM
ncbi:MAG: ABC transporter permease subunit [Intestinimonas sp.]